MGRRGCEAEVLLPLAGVEDEIRALENALADALKQIAYLEEENARLREALEKARRGGKRQAAPFSKGDPKQSPKRPGRKAGEQYGRRGHRTPPEHVDEVVDVPCPELCPFCGGAVEDEGDVEPQYQAEAPPVKPHVTRFDLHGGRCCRCRRRVRGRDERQCSNAVGAAGSHLGPRALALAAQFHVELGLSYGKVQRVLEVLFGLSITRGGLAQAVYRVGHALDPTYRALVEAVPRAPVVCPDETGWRVGGVLCWLWVFVAGDVVVYGILPGRGFEEATTILPAEYSGTISRDGWGPYRRYLAARHDSCKAHLLRRCNELLEVAERGAARVPHEVKRILQGALALRDRRDLGEISPHGLAVARGRLEARTDRLLSWQPTDDENRKFLAHLKVERDALFSFLDEPGIPATNYQAEQAIRPAVVNRKVWGGNRTWNGAMALERIMTATVTGRRQGSEPIDIIVPVLRSPVPMIAPLRSLGPLGPDPPSGIVDPTLSY